MTKRDSFGPPAAIVQGEAEIGEGTEIWHHAHVRHGAKLGENCVLGNGVYVGEGVKIADNVKIENYVSLQKGVTIEDNIFIGPHTTFTNDLHPRIERFGKQKVGRTVVRKGASMGAGSTVTQSIPDHALVYGNPARMHGQVCFCGEILGDLQEQVHLLSGICEKCGNKVEIKSKSQQESFD